MTIKTPEQVASTATNDWLNTYEWPYSERRDFSATEIADAVEGLIAAAIEADRAQRSERIVVASADGARTWIGGDTLADLLETVKGYLEDGYKPEELLIEGVTR